MKTSKFLATLLALCIVLSLSVTAFASGEPSGEVSGEPSGEAVSVEDAYLEYLHDWLVDNLDVNISMTIEQVEDEFMPAFEAAAETGDWLTNTVNGAPLDILFNGMLESGNAMTFEEFAAQYEPAADAAAGGDTSEEAYKAYLKEYVDAVPAVSDEQYEEFAAAIDAGNYNEFPVDMCFQDTYWGHVALTYDEFVAAGGAYEIPAFDPSLTAD